MKRYLLDTNVISELRKPRPHGAVVEWIQSLNEVQIVLSAVTFGELQAGVELTRKQDPPKAEEIQNWIDQLSRAFNVLPMDADCFREWGRLAAQKPVRFMGDAMLAATARVHGVAIATRNVRDFRHFQVEILNPFAAGRA